MDTIDQFERRLEKSHNLEEKVRRVSPFVGLGVLMGLAAGYIASENQDNLKYPLLLFTFSSLLDGAYFYRRTKKNPEGRDYHLMRLKDGLLVAGSAMAATAIYYF